MISIRHQSKHRAFNRTEYRLLEETYYAHLPFHCLCRSRRFRVWLRLFDRADVQLSWGSAGTDLCFECDKRDANAGTDKRAEQDDTRYHSQVDGERCRDWRSCWLWLGSLIPE